ncbi:MAG TPA: hypothetical protein VMS17_15755 [Gemmataceae bacterium]|nr:hypothetical protein [Gemmataceae bacterium]
MKSSGIAAAALALLLLSSLKAMGQGAPPPAVIQPLTEEQAKDAIKKIEQSPAMQERQRFEEESRATAARWKSFENYWLNGGWVRGDGGNGGNPWAELEFVAVCCLVGYLFYVAGRKRRDASPKP